MERHYINQKFCMSLSEKSILCPTTQPEFWLLNIGYVAMRHVDYKQSIHYKIQICLIIFHYVDKSHVSTESIPSIPASPAPWARAKSCQRKDVRDKTVELHTAVTGYKNITKRLSEKVTKVDVINLK